MLDVSTVSPTRVRAGATAVVTCAGDALELRVWPAEDVWAVAGRLAELGLDPQPVLPDESGLPGSLLVHREGAGEESGLRAVLDGLRLPGLEVLAFGEAGADGTSRRVVTGGVRDAAAEPADGHTDGRPDRHGDDQGDDLRDRVVFVELHELPGAPRWQVRGLGTRDALRRLGAALSGLAAAPAVRHDGAASLVLEVPERPGAVQAVVEHLDGAGLDGHVRVLRRRAG